MDQNNSDVKKLAPGAPQIVEPGSVIRIEYSASPEICQSFPDVMSLNFQNRPEPFVAGTPPPPFVPPPNYPFQSGHGSPGQIDQSNLRNFAYEEQNRRDDWERQHPSHSFQVQAKVLPGSHDGERFLEGSIQIRFQPNIPGYGTIYADTYYLTNPFSVAPNPQGGGIVYQLSEEAQREIESYSLVVKKDYLPPPPPQPPPPHVIQVADFDIEVAPSPIELSIAIYPEGATLISYTESTAPDKRHFGAADLSLDQLRAIFQKSHLAANLPLLDGTGKRFVDLPVVLTDELKTALGFNEVGHQIR